jgi:23S rRNA pseudouridine1911/1915/1917 synthase
MEIKIVYEDKNLLAIDKPAGMVVFPEDKINQRALIDELLKKFPYLRSVGSPPRYGIVHRLDKETSGILLVAKNNKTLTYLQRQFKTRKVLKKYLALIVGRIKDKEGTIETLLGRHPKERKKQRVYLPHEPLAKKKNLRKAITKYKTIREFKNYTLLEIEPKTGRKHQIRCHLSFLGHPIAGDKVYGFKNQPQPKGLKRQFLHASYLKITLPNGKEKGFASELPDDLKRVLSNLKS